LNFSELRALAPGIPTLAEALAVLRPAQPGTHQVHVMLEIKERFLQTERQLKMLTETFARLRPVHDFHLLTLEPELLEPYSPTFPKSCFVDVIWTNPLQTFADNQRLDHGGIAGHFLFFPDAKRESLRKQHKSFGVGFIASRRSLYRELAKGADWIFTDDALLIQSFLQKS
jgi:glycerophosphoryl diester phosphodiesterase